MSYVASLCFLIQVVLNFIMKVSRKKNESVTNTTLASTLTTFIPIGVAFLMALSLICLMKFRYLLKKQFELFDIKKFLYFRNDFPINLAIPVHFLLSVGPFLVVSSQCVQFFISNVQLRKSLKSLLFPSTNVISVLQ